MVALANITGRDITVDLPLKETGRKEREWYDLIAKGRYHVTKGQMRLTLEPFGILWLEPFIE